MLQIRKIIFGALLAGAVLPAAAQGTDAILRLRDERRRHPEISSITFPGNTVWRHAYDAVYSHGAIVENPWAALRIYMNEGHGVDAYLKATTGLECRQTGFYTDSIGRSQGLGADVLYVGRSIGAGSFRGFDGAATVALDSVRSRTMSVLNDSTVELRVEGWLYNGHPIDVVETYTAHSDRRAFDVVVELVGAEAGDFFCTGVQKLAVDAEGAFSDEGGRKAASSRGANAPDSKRPDLLERVALRVASADATAVAETPLDYLLVFPAARQIRYTIEVGRP